MSNKNQVTDTTSNTTNENQSEYLDIEEDDYQLLLFGILIFGFIGILIILQKFVSL